MKSARRSPIISLFLTVLFLSWSAGASKPPAAQWSFEGAKSGDSVRGYAKFVPGVSGTALRFDGQTTSLVRAAAGAPRLGGAFTIEAWAAIQAYPWTWCAVVNQEKDHKAGYLFGIDPEGFFGLQLAVGGEWQECRSDVRLPLYSWNHLAAAFDASSGITLYLNGKAAGRKPLTGKPSFAPQSDLWLGRNLTPLGLSQEVKVVAEVAYSFDGIIDEVRIHDRSLRPEEIRATHAALAPSGPAPLRPPVLPAGPPGPGRFGAYAARLRYTDEWERPWRVGDSPDVVVRFDESGERLVFWRGTSYIPAWVTENGIWYNNEFYETQDGSMTTSVEPMADKQARFSHARILESNDARAVVLWRYAPVTVETEPVFPDPLTGWHDWVEETYTVYPDRSCVRKIRTWSTKPTVVPTEGKGLENFRQFHEVIIINPPGTRPEDNIHPDALTLANMKGETHTYSWAKDAPGFPADFDAETRALLRRISDQDPAAHKWLTLPRKGNILRVNLKAKASPYIIVDPRGVAIDCYAGEIIRERSMFPWWNHWPVSQQIRSNGRWAVAPDRVSHSSLAHIQSWKPYEESAEGLTMLMLNGLSDKPAEGLVPLAKSWLSPPKIEVAPGAFAAEGYDPVQKAFVVSRRTAATPAPGAALEAMVRASADSPLVNPALVVRNWGEAEPRITIDGRPAPAGKDVRVGRVPRLEGEDLVIWLRLESSSPVRIAVRPADDQK